MLIGPKNPEEQEQEDDESISMDIMVVPHSSGMLNVCVYRKNKRPILADIVSDDYNYTWGVLPVPPNPEMFDMMLMAILTKPKKPIAYH